MAGEQRFSWHPDRRHEFTGRLRDRQPTGRGPFGGERERLGPGAQRDGRVPTASPGDPRGLEPDSRPGARARRGRFLGRPGGTVPGGLPVGRIERRGLGRDRAHALAPHGPDPRPPGPRPREERGDASRLPGQRRGRGGARRLARPVGTVASDPEAARHSGRQCVLSVHRRGCEVPVYRADPAVLGAPSRPFRPRTRPSTRIPLARIGEFRRRLRPFAGREDEPVRNGRGVPRLHCAADGGCGDRVRHVPGWSRCDRPLSQPIGGRDLGLHHGFRTER